MDYQNVIYSYAQNRRQTRNFHPKSVYDENLRSLVLRVIPTLLKFPKVIKKNLAVRSGIRTHAHRSGLRPERSALDRSAILTHSNADKLVPRAVE
ncbi:hypothetical protein AVEN_91849-1 [Araneus ventricosus]|uniref:Uncharacterized protein n=1 Tax=Araneus ventricosus TaxID=182803 RepID=A0A4Y2G4Y4_ARAVE|nr:hypothetical protein AVEN_91849-1 [Araneus ventricosus]